MALLMRVCGVFALGLALMAQAGAPPPTQTPTEYELKAAFLFNFAKFVKWPQAASGPFCIGVVGQDPFGAALDDVVQGKSINGRGLVIRRFKPGQEPANCQIVFISSSERKQLPALLVRAEREAVLTVGDMPGFCQDGGVINLQLADGRVHLEVNLRAAENAHLQLSSKLLSLARIVRAEQP